MLHKLLERNRDSFLLSLFFLEEADCCSLAATCKSFLFVATDEQLWREFAITRIPWIFNDFADKSEAYKWENVVQPLMDSFGFPSHKSLHQCLQHCNFSPFDTILRVLPSDQNTCRGGIFRIKRAIDGVVHLRQLDCLDAQLLYLNTSSEMHLSYDANRKHIVTVVDGYIKNLIFHNNGISMKISEDKSWQLKTMPVLKSDESKVQERIGDRYDSCLGYFCAVYGSHGTEVLHISIHTSQSSHYVENDQFGEIQLQGLKLTGDPNVPAGNLSFCVNVADTCDIDLEIQRDRRPLVLFDALGNVALMEIRSRRASIKSWTKGFGQINRDPSNWAPEWVGCNLIVYDQIENGAAFIIMWDDESEAFRHAMEFQQCELIEP